MGFSLLQRAKAANPAAVVIGQALQPQAESATYRFNPWESGYSEPNILLPTTQKMNAKSGRGKHPAHKCDLWNAVI